VLTDTVPLARTLDKIEVVSVAEHFADAIRRIYSDESVSTLFIP
jgi:ribose-phosphate pyrophosphokinase